MVNKILYYNTETIISKMEIHIRRVVYTYLEIRVKPIAKIDEKDDDVTSLD